MNEELREQFMAVMARCRKMDAAFSSQCEMQTNELTILHIISGKCACCESRGINLDIRKVQDHLQISKPVVSYILNTLEKKAYIQREIDPRDRRRIAIRITPEGSAAAEISMQHYSEAWNHILSEFGEEEMKELVVLLNRLFSIMEGECG